MNRANQIFNQVVAALRKDGSFAQSYAIVLSGTGVNILVQILITPIITRIYGPEAYGTYSIFNAIATNIAMVATLRFPQALLLPPRERDFHILMRVTVVSALATTAITFMAFYFAATPLLKWLGAEKLIDYYFLIPLMVLLISLNQIFGQWQYRLDKFKKSVAIDTGILIGVRVFNLSYGMLAVRNTIGLLLGDMLGKTVGLFFSWRLIIKEQIRFLFTAVSFEDFWRLVKEYKHYPIFNLPGVWATLFSEQLVVFFVSSHYGVSTLGVLSLAVSMLDLPKRLFAYTVTSVFFKKAVEVYKSSLEELQTLVLRVMYGLLAACVLPYGLVTAFGEELFTFVFGQDWLLSGKLAQYIAIYCVFELLYISLDSVYYVLRKERKLFAFQVATFALRLGVMVASVQLSLPLEECILTLTVANSILYLSHLGYILHLLRLKWFKHLFFIVMIEASCVLFFFGLRQLFY
ncbi:MAG: lipopolysaccharide biosynthesis protein [Cyclobacteriaceae bacterium]